MIHSSQLLAAIKQYVKNVLVGIDNLLSALTGGDPDECISSRLGKSRRGDFGKTAKFLLMPIRLVVDVVAWLLGGGWDHCRREIEDDEGSREVLL